jgi:alpha-D-ribose 1-methylphosphonate 5-triphosphate synthase subunit PhnH
MFSFYFAHHAARVNNKSGALALPVVDYSHTFKTTLSQHAHPGSIVYACVIARGHVV